MQHNKKVYSYSVANPKQVAILKRGPLAWVAWKTMNLSVRPDLHGADLSRLDFRHLDLKHADLRGALLAGSDLRGSDLQGADLSGSDLIAADLSGADLRGANLEGSYLGGTKLNRAAFSSQTRWPPGYRPTDSGAVLTPDSDLPPRLSVEDVEANCDRAPQEDFSIWFAPELTSQQVTATLSALADYYRACGGVGFRIDFELFEVRAEEPVHVRQ